MTSIWHQTNFRVPYKDTDRMGVVHHGNYVMWFENARTECMRHYGIIYSQMEKLGFLLPVMDVHVTYKKSAHYDDCIAVFTKVTSQSPVRLEFSYEARKISEEDLAYSNGKDTETTVPYGELIVKGTTLHMWVNQKWKPTRMDKAAPEIYATIQNIV